MEAKALALTQADEEKRELLTILKMSIGMWEAARPEVERRVAYLVRRCVLRPFRSTGKWNVLSRKCDICQQLQPSAQELVSHRYEAHTIPTAYTCLICYATTTRKYLLHNHVVRKHMHNKVPADDDDSSAFSERHKCTLCPKSYSSKKSLRYHTKTHNGEMPIACDVCHRQYMYSCELKVHMRVHTRVKPYECDLCHKSFAYSGQFASHKRMHTSSQYQCYVCHKSYSSSHVLHRHIKVHTE